MISAVVLVGLLLAADQKPKSAPQETETVTLPGGFSASMPTLPGPPVTARELLFRRSCYTGVVLAQAVFPRAPDDLDMLHRGFLSCDGAILRMRKDGALEKEKDLVESACAYGAGAMFLKRGAEAEVRRPSPRLLHAAKDCAEHVHAQGH